VVPVNETTIPLHAIREWVARTRPDARLRRVAILGEDAFDDTTEKGIGYGEPIEVDLEGPDGRRERLVLHTSKANDYGHDRRADRAEAMLLAWDSFGRIPQHSEAVDVGYLDAHGHLRSMADATELYLVTRFVPGSLYADDLRRIAQRAELEERDLRRVDALADYLVALHAQRIDRPAAYRRAIRDLVGDGEGIFGIVDGYPPDTPGASPARLEALEQRCLAYRWRLRGKEPRLCRTHNDFHPFNLLFDDDDRLGVLDTSRGSCGDAADDVSCVALNYVFFALSRPEAWASALGPLWRRFFARYLAGSKDDEVLEVAPPYLAWRALVLASPDWYPHMTAEARDRLLAFCEAALDAGRLDVDAAERLFA
jgi:hypothetical protein